MYKFILNQKEYTSEHQFVDGDYIRRFASPTFTPPPKFYKLYLRLKHLGTQFNEVEEIGNDEKIDLSNDKIIEFILMDGIMSTNG